jgi:hypothetical protein
MKQFVTRSLISAILILAGCKKENVNQLDLLPPETHTGAYTFGCLVNGNAFLPKGPSNTIQCAYQFIYDMNDKGYFFQLSAADNSNSSHIRSVGVFTDSLPITDGMVIDLTTYATPGKAYGQYYKDDIITYSTYQTTDVVKGQLIITYLDEIKQIVAGTFWFDAIDKNGDTVKVTEGRFDMLFTK